MPLLHQHYFPVKKEDITDNQPTITSYAQVSHQNLTFPINGLSYDVCTREIVHLTGSTGLTSNVTQVDYFIYVTATFNFVVSGVGQISGNKYELVGHQTEQYKWDTRLGSTIIDNYNRRTTVITAGAKNNMTITQITHLILDADGQVRVQIDELDFKSCQ